MRASQEDYALDNLVLQCCCFFVQLHKSYTFMYRLFLYGPLVRDSRLTRSNGRKIRRRELKIAREAYPGFGPHEAAHEEMSLVGAINFIWIDYFKF